MDTFNFLVSGLIMLMAIHLNEPLIAIGIMVVSILTSKDLSTVILFVVASLVMYFFVGTESDNFWLIAIFGLIILSVVFGSKSEPQQPEMGLGYGDMLGGMGGGYG